MINSLKIDAIVLNGTSSSGKSSLAKCIQSNIKEPVLNFPLDSFWDMVQHPEIADSDNFPYMKEVISETASGKIIGI